MGRNAQYEVMNALVYHNHELERELECAVQGNQSHRSVRSNRGKPQLCSDA